MIKVDKYDLVNRIEEELYIRNSLETYEVNKTEVYKALAKCIRDIIAYSWSPSKDKLFSKKQIYLFSFEYNTSNFLSKNLNYLGLSQVARESLGILGYNLDEILNCEVFPLLGEGELGDLSYFMLESNCKNKVKAYGLRYENGRFKQEIIDHRQVEMVKSWTMEEFPWEIKRNREDINIFGKDIKSTSYDIKVLTKNLENINVLRLFESNIERLTYPMKIIEGEGLKEIESYMLINSLSRFLYMEDVNPMGKKIRLGQEYFLASSGVKDIVKDLKREKEIDFKNKFTILLNENHTLITIPVFIKEFCDNFKLTKEEALKLVETNFQYRSFEGIDINKKIWSESLIREVCPDILEYLDFIYDFFEIEGQNPQYYNFYEILFHTVKNIFPMSKIQRDSFYKGYEINTGEKPVREYEIQNNLLNIVPWLWESNPKLYGLLSAISDKNSLQNPNLLKALPEKFTDEQQSAVIKIKYENKLKIKNMISKKYKIFLNPKSIYVMQFETFQEKRRQFLTCLYLTDKYFELIDNSNLDMPDLTYFIGGLSSPKYLASKYVIRYINVLKDLVNSDLSIKDKLKIVFIEDLNREKMMRLSKGCDVVEQIATPGLEVVANNVLNFMINGSVVMGSRTGINLELAETKKEFIYLFGSSKEEIEGSFRDCSKVEENIFKKSRLGNVINKIRNSNFIELKDSFEEIYNLILKYNDSFQVFRDYDDYYGTWKEIEKDYRDKRVWTKKTLQSIRSCGEFSNSFEI